MPMIAVVAAVSPAHAESKQWLPMGQWQIDSANDRCAAFRTFSRGKNRMTVAFKPRPMSKYVAILLEARGEIPGIRLLEAKIDVGSGRTTKKAVVSHSAKPGQLLYDIPITRDDLAMAVSSGRLLVSSGTAQADLSIADLNLATLDACMSDLLAKWGLSKPDQARIARFPEPEVSLNSLVSDYDYPTAALARRSIGRVEARVTIHTDGSISDCRIVRSSGHKPLDDMMCEVVGRARFRPAIDDGGVALSSPYYFAINWMMPPS